MALRGALAAPASVPGERRRGRRTPRRGLGTGVLEAIRAGGFAGRLHVVHPEADSVAGLPAHRSLAAIGEPVDLVVVVVPADQVIAVMADATAAGVRCSDRRLVRPRRP